MSTLYQAYTEPSTTILWIRYCYTQWAANINHLPAMASSNSNQLTLSFFSLRAYTYSIRIPPDDSCLDHRQEHNLGQSIHSLAEKGQHGQLNSLGFLSPGYTLESPGDLFKHSGTRVHHRPIKSGWGLGELDIHILQSTLVDSDMKSRVSEGEWHGLRTVVLSVRSPKQKHQHLLETCQKYRFSGSTPDLLD